MDGKIGAMTARKSFRLVLVQHTPASAGKAGLTSVLQSITEPNKWALHELADLPTHAVGNVCLMGDAAAATLPHQVRFLA